MKRLLASAALSVLLYSARADAFALVDGTVVYVENGWTGEGVAFHLSNSLPNSGCAAPGYDFAVPISHPAYKEIVVMIMSAYFSGRPVELVVNPGTCTFGARVQIVSIRLV